MYFLKPNYIVKQKSSGELRAETNSGRNLFIIFIVLILLFNEKYIMFPGIFLCFIIWTYQKEWIIKKFKNKLFRRKKILWIVYDEIELEIDNIREIGIEKIASAQAVGHDYRLYLKTNEGKSFNVTTRSRCSDIKPIVSDIREMLPESVLFNAHEDFFKKEKFIRFD